ncbi:hypothetical protein Bca4012_026661 [Brassica carinata]
MRAPWIKNYSFDVKLSVSTLINPTSRRWNEFALQEVFVPGDIELIKRKQPVIGERTFTRGDSTKMTAPKIRIFLWKALNEALPVAVLINRRGMKVDDRCQLCGVTGEDINHVFFGCSFVRQVWALSNIPSPQHGFHSSSIFENLWFLFQAAKLTVGEMEFKRAWPWVIWNIWKCRNGLMFEGKRLSPLEIGHKALGESEEWFLAQVVEKDMEKKQASSPVCTRASWKPPPKTWLKCNIASDWNKKTTSMGAESMTSLKLNKIIMAGEMDEFFGAVLRPHKWPSFGFQRQEILACMANIEEWKVLVMKREANRGAGFIAESVNKYNLVQSYVATGHPAWLFGFFVNESRYL